MIGFLFETNQKSFKTFFGNAKLFDQNVFCFSA